VDGKKRLIKAGRLAIGVSQEVIDDYDKDDWSAGQTLCAL